MHKNQHHVIYIYIYIYACILEAVETHGLLFGRKSRGGGGAVFGASFCDIRPDFGSTTL